MIPNWLMQRAYLTPDKIALSFEEEKWTFAQLKDDAVILARKLRANGLNEGQRIALLGPSNAEMVFIIHACMLAGLEIVMLNSRLTKKEIAYQLDDSGATTVIVSDELSGVVADIPVRQLLFSAIKDSAEQQFVIRIVGNQTGPLRLCIHRARQDFRKVFVKQRVTMFRVHCLLF